MEKYDIFKIMELGILIINFHKEIIKINDYFPYDLTNMKLNVCIDEFIKSEKTDNILYIDNNVLYIIKYKDRIKMITKNNKLFRDLAHDIKNDLNKLLSVYDMDQNDTILEIGDKIDKFVYKE